MPHPLASTHTFPALPSTTPVTGRDKTRPKYQTSRIAEDVLELHLRDHLALSSRLSLQETSNCFTCFKTYKRHDVLAHGIGSEIVKQGRQTAGMAGKLAGLDAARPASQQQWAGIPGDARHLASFSHLAWLEQAW